MIIKFACRSEDVINYLRTVYNSVRFQGLLGPKKELWDILQMVEKYSLEAADITASVRDLPTVK